MPKHAFHSYRILIQALCFAMASIGNAGWVQSGGPAGGEVSSIAFDSGSVFVGTTGGVFRSDDSGNSWVPANSGMENIPVASLAAKDGKVFASTYSGVYRSTDRGKTWVTTGSKGSNLLGSVLVFSGSTLVLGAMGQAYATNGDGLAWNELGNTFGTDVILAMGIMGGDLYASVDAPSLDYAPLFKYSTSDKRWITSNDGIDAEKCFSMAGMGRYSFVGTETGVFRSSDNGATWKPANTGIPQFAENIKALAVMGKDIFAGTEVGGVFRSSDSGSTWIQASFAFETNAANTLKAGGGGLFIVTDRGVARSNDLGNTWFDCRKGLFNTAVLALHSLDGKLFAGSDGMGAAISADNGKTWKDAYSNDSNGEFRFNRVSGFASRNSRLYASTDYGIYRTSDGGNSWIEFIAIPEMRGLDQITFGGVTLYSAEYQSGIFQAPEGSSLFTRILEPNASPLPNCMVGFGDNLIVGAYPKGIYRSADKGGHWEQPKGSVQSEVILSLLEVDGTLFAGTQSNGVYRSTDSGINWARFDTGIKDQYVSSLAAIGKSVFAGTQLGGVYVSIDNGESWKKDNSGFPDFIAFRSNSIRALAIQAGKLFAGIDGIGVWMRPLSEMTSAVLVQNFKSTKPTRFRALSGSSTEKSKFEFTMVKKGDVGISLVDIHGNAPVPLFSASELGSGTHLAELDFGRVSTGVYLLTLAANGERTTIKWVVGH